MDEPALKIPHTKLPFAGSAGEKRKRKKDNWGVAELFLIHFETLTHFVYVSSGGFVKYNRDTSSSNSI